MHTSKGAAVEGLLQPAPAGPKRTHVFLPPANQRVLQHSQVPGLESAALEAPTSAVPAPPFSTPQPKPSSQRQPSKQNSNTSPVKSNLKQSPAAQHFPSSAGAPPLEIGPHAPVSAVVHHPHAKHGNHISPSKTATATTTAAAAAHIAPAAAASAFRTAPTASSVLKPAAEPSGRKKASVKVPAPRSKSKAATEPEPIRPQAAISDAQLRRLLSGPNSTSSATASSNNPSTATHSSPAAQRDHLASNNATSPILASPNVASHAVHHVGTVVSHAVHHNGAVDSMQLASNLPAHRQAEAAPPSALAGGSAMPQQAHHTFHPGSSAPGINLVNHGSDSKQQYQASLPGLGPSPVHANIHLKAQIPPDPFSQPANAMQQHGVGAAARLRGPSSSMVDAAVNASLDPVGAHAVAAREVAIQASPHIEVMESDPRASAAGGPVHENAEGSQPWCNQAVPSQTPSKATGPVSLQVNQTIESSHSTSNQAGSPGAGPASQSGSPDSNSSKNEATPQSDRKGGRHFMSAMSDLVPGPSAEQRRKALEQRTQLQRDLEEQIRQKKEREEKHRAAELAAQLKEEKELRAYQQMRQSQPKVLAEEKASGGMERSSIDASTIKEQEVKHSPMPAWDSDVQQVERPRRRAKYIIDASWLDDVASNNDKDASVRRSESLPAFNKKWQAEDAEKDVRASDQKSCSGKQETLHLPPLKQWRASEPSTPAVPQDPLPPLKTSGEEVGVMLQLLQREHAWMQQEFDQHMQTLDRLHNGLQPLYAPNSAPTELTKSALELLSAPLLLGQPLDRSHELDHAVLCAEAGSLSGKAGQVVENAKGSPGRREGGHLPGLNNQGKGKRIAGGKVEQLSDKSDMNGLQVDTYLVPATQNFIPESLPLSPSTSQQGLNSQTLRTPSLSASHTTLPQIHSSPPCWINPSQTHLISAACSLHTSMLDMPILSSPIGREVDSTSPSLPIILMDSNSPTQLCPDSCRTSADFTRERLGLKVKVTSGNHRQSSSGELLDENEASKARGKAVNKGKNSRVQDRGNAGNKLASTEAGADGQASRRGSNSTIGTGKIARGAEGVAVVAGLATRPVGSPGIIRADYLSSPARQAAKKPQAAKGWKM